MVRVAYASLNPIFVNSIQKRKESDMDTAILLGFLAAGMQLVGYFLYWKSSRSGETNSNPVSWLIWTYGSLISLGTYSQMTGDWVKSLLPIACAVACVFICFQVFRQNGLGKLDRFDYVVLGLDLVVTVVWYFVGPMPANLLDQGSTIVSFFPLIRGMVKGINKEAQAPWLIWTIAYLLLGVTVVMRYDKWEDLAYPVVCAVMHMIIWVIALIKRPRLTL